MVKVYVLTNCEIGSERYVIDEPKTSRVLKKHIVSWEHYDIMTDLDSPSRKELQKTIIWKIRKMGMIRSTLTLVGIDRQGYST